MNTFLLTVATPDGTALKERVISLSLRGAEGDLAILAGHVPFSTVVKPCVCKIETENETEISARVDGGILSVTRDGATLLSSTFRREN